MVNITKGVYVIYNKDSPQIFYICTTIRTRDKRIKELEDEGENVDWSKMDVDR